MQIIQNLQTIPRKTKAPNQKKNEFQCSKYCIIKFVPPAAVKMETKRQKAYIGDLALGDLALAGKHGTRFNFVAGSVEFVVEVDASSAAGGTKLLSDNCTISGLEPEYKGSFSQLEKVYPEFHNEVNKHLKYLGYRFGH